MEQKLKIKDVSKELVDFAKSEFAGSKELKYADKVFEDLQYGEIILSVSEGNITHVKIIKNLKPASVDNGDQN